MRRKKKPAVKTVKPWVARLYPEENSSLYVRVQVWPTKQAMLQHINEHHYPRNGGRFGARTEGTCSRYEAYRVTRKRSRKSPCFAEVNLWRGQLGMSVITHEFFHATIAFAQRVGIRFDDLKKTRLVTPTEERLCYAHGELCRQFTLKGMRPGGVYTDADLVKSA